MLLLWIIIFCVSLFILIKAADYFTESAEKIGYMLKISPFIVGVTIISIGTSLPELATSAVAAYKHNADIAIGNIIGSNIFNIFWILGLSAMIKPLYFSATLNIDIYIMAVITIILFMFMFVGRKNVLQRSQGVILVLIYISYIIYLIMRG